MNAKAVLFVLGNLAIILAGALIAPLVVAIVYDSGGPHEIHEVKAFGITASLTLAVGIILRLVFRDAESKVQVREGFAIVTFAWLLFALFGMLPYLLTGVVSSTTDAFFETMSGFTTTGASIFSEVEFLPHGVQFWRCMTQWLGGMGIVVLSVALLPVLGVGGYRILKAETPGGVAFERDRPRITDAAKDMWELYLVFSAVQCFLLVLCGMSPYDAMCHTFTTMSTGGFSTHTASVGHFTSPLIQWVIIIFMVIAGVNFSVHAHFIRGRLKLALLNLEFRFFLYMLTVSVLIGLMVQPTGSSAEEAIRNITFQVVSIATSTGFATEDFEQWVPLMKFVLVGLMIVGGCMGSTAGGIKVTRILVFGKNIIRELHRMIYPHGVRPLRVGTRVLEPHVGANIMAFGSLYTLSFVLGTMTMVAYEYDLLSSCTASLAALSNIGPGLGQVGPAQNWGHLPDTAKWVMSTLMLMGRLELFSVVILFSPWVWRR
ncbi:MAG: potassium transporter TrkG [Myxococcota bacterium]|nr:potassium transporter TrkG [Myxococcota bacterium]